MKNKKGITLIALIITIIVMLILAGITISMIVGEDGVINQAQNAETKQQYAAAKEMAQMQVTYEDSGEKSGKIDLNATKTNLDNLKDELEEIKEIKEVKNDEKLEGLIVEFNDGTKLEITETGMTFGKITSGGGTENPVEPPDSVEPPTGVYVVDMGGDGKIYITLTEDLTITSYMFGQGQLFSGTYTTITEIDQDLLIEVGAPDTIIDNYLMAGFIANTPSGDAKFVVSKNGENLYLYSGAKMVSIKMDTSYKTYFDKIDGTTTGFAFKIGTDETISFGVSQDRITYTPQKEGTYENVSISEALKNVTVSGISQSESDYSMAGKATFVGESLDEENGTNNNEESSTVFYFLISKDNFKLYYGKIGDGAPGDAEFLPLN